MNTCLSPYEIKDAGVIRKFWMVPGTIKNFFLAGFKNLLGARDFFFYCPNFLLKFGNIKGKEFDFHDLRYYWNYIDDIVVKSMVWWLKFEITEIP